MTHRPFVVAGRRAWGEGEMRSSGVRRFRGVLAAAILGLGAVAAVSPPAAGAAVGVAKEAGVAGDYDFFVSSGEHDTVTLSANGSFQNSNGDSGQWVALRKAVVLRVSSSGPEFGLSLSGHDGQDGDQLRDQGGTHQLRRSIQDSLVRREDDGRRPFTRSAT